MEKNYFLRTQDLPTPPKVFDNEYLKKVRIVIGTTSIKVFEYDNLKCKSCYFTYIYYSKGYKNTIKVI